MALIRAISILTKKIAVKHFVAFSFCILFLASSAQEKKILLPNDWSLTPAGKMTKVGDLPLNMAISPDKKYIAVTNNGQGVQSIQLIDTKTFAVCETRKIDKSWLGLKFSRDGKYLFASGGNDNLIVKYQVKNGKLSEKSKIKLGKKWPEKISPAGIDIDDDAGKLYAVTKEDNSLYIVDLKTEQVTKKIPLGAEGYTCLLSPDKSRLYISLWGGDKVILVDTKTETIIDSVTVARNPNDMCLTKTGAYLFVANSIDNTVSVIETATNRVVETLNAAMFTDALSGSTTNSVALSENDKMLYIANADNNCLAVFDVTKPGHSYSKGFIPTGWYPTCVRLIGHTVYVANGKGTSSLPNPRGPQPVNRNGQASYKKGNKNTEQYIGSLFTGTVSRFAEGDEEKLAIWSKQVYSNSPYSREKELQTAGEPGNPVPMKLGTPSPIKHVFYIIKENRTYDQVLADMPGGNGDTSLLLFGQKITPNQHAIARDFVLLDNFYVDAEVSADGHNWSTAAYANDFVEKTWPTNYGGRGGTYDYAANKKIALPKNGFLWDYALRGGASFRDYGEFTDDDGRVYLSDLRKHMCSSFPGWNLSIYDTTRERIWEHDFDSLTSINAVPQLNIVYFPSDHTAGLNKKSRTPFAYVADNDLAVGLFLEHLSQSDIWRNSVVFILEDDAQNGPDHVDAHRSTAYVAGPFVKRKFVDHTMYSTSSMLHTIELILGLPPMSQYDAGAVPMFRCFTNETNARPFTHLPCLVNLNQLNSGATSTKKVADLDFTSPDMAPDLELNQQIWESIKGNSQYPAPTRSAFVALSKDDD